MRVIGLVHAIAALVGLAIFAAPAAGQTTNAVDCGNGYYCPADNACLVGGMCGRVVEAAPGSVQTSRGTWCDPGFRENQYRPGTCVPGSYTECPSGMICPPGTQCGGDGACTGGPPPTGPMCGAGQCAAGRICSSRGTCMNTQYFQDCGNGTICSKASACEFPNGCVFVAPQRTRQLPIRR